MKGYLDAENWTWAILMTINPIMNDVLGWGQSAKGYLSEQSSQADFLAIHSFFLEFCKVESRIKQGSCLGAMMPRTQVRLITLSLCNRILFFMSHGRRQSIIRRSKTFWKDNTRRNSQNNYVVDYNLTSMQAYTSKHTYMLWLYAILTYSICPDSASERPKIIRASRSKVRNLWI